ncbi:MAG: hemolysin family protein [Chitinophagales bacterium]|jgi:CBS domain containing-hemolysin-like protein
MSWLIAGLSIYIALVLAERAIVAITPYEMEQLRAEDSTSARRALLVLGENSRRSLAALALGRFLILLLLVLLSSTLLSSSQIWNTELFSLSQSQGMAIRTATILSAFILLITLLWQIGKINLRRDQFPIAGKWLRRLSWLPMACSTLFNPLLPKKAVPEEEVLKEEESTKNQKSRRRDIEMLKSIAKFGEVTVRQVMQPQPKIVAVEQSASFHEVLTTIRKAGFSRIPVFADGMDNIFGVLYIKDIVAHLDKPPHFNWQEKVRTDVLIVPETKPISELLQEFKLEKKHLALVVDEYGGTAGLVTLEDILEEITGEIRDEFDEANEIPPYEQLDAQHYRFSGSTMINDVCEIAGIDPETFDRVREDADTIAGLVLELTGEIPTTGTQISWGQYTFTVEKADKRRIEVVLMAIQAD